MKMGLIAGQSGVSETIHLARAESTVYILMGPSFPLCGDGD